MSLADKFSISYKARAAAIAYGPPDPVPKTFPDGSKTSPFPVTSNKVSLSATINTASKCRKYLSVLHNLASSTQLLRS